MQSVNATDILSLLQAETASLSSTVEWVKPLYEKAIAQLSQSGFSHFSVIANKQIGNLMLASGDSFWGKHYLK
jgi:hypothetical protein